ncbi:unnamed protein product [Thlaspi arvense]|uniref:Uncharacterized protein n=1 Tax=Thlaspi arvense TaxID=13288 RepID=A0AAU9SG61_THLAR|nr:unnamed protein product [Thlaspi arvense]
MFRGSSIVCDPMKIPGKGFDLIETTEKSHAEHTQNFIQWDGEADRIYDKCFGIIWGLVLAKAFTF